VLSACANLGFVYGEPVAREASRLGASPAAASLTRWLPVYWGGFATVAAWCAVTLWRRGTWRCFAGKGSATDLGLALGAGGLLYLAQAPYGIGAHYLGTLGTSVGWAMCIGVSLMVANAFGFVTGEWRGASVGAMRTLCVGLAVLGLAIVSLAVGNAMAVD
jgi:L-rhamnose-H+ transport protein